jgi:glycosyltransferase involved in cell wall biosynthesis
VTLVAGRRPETPGDLADLLPAGVELVTLPWTRRRPREQVAAARALRRLVRQRRPDVVHLHSSFAGAVGAFALRGRAPLVYTPHAYSFARTDGPGRRAAYRGVEWTVARRCDIVAAVSEDEARLARTVLRAPRVTVVTNGIRDLDPGALPGVPARAAPVVVAAGRIGAQRRPTSTARVLSAVAATGARVAWIGGAPAGEDAPLRAAGIPVTGWLPRPEALDRLAGATVYLHWSAWDGQSLTMLEALARDVVVVASDIPANREVVGNRQVFKDEAGAVDLIVTVLRDPSVREALLAEQRARRGRFSARRMVEEWIDLYDATSRARNIGAQWI